MKILFLGTGAAGSKLRPETEIQPHHRRCASLLIDDNVVVDMALQSHDFATKLGVDTSAVTDVFISHMHRDHYNKEALLGYIGAAKGKINVWCNKRLVQSLDLSEEELEKVNVCPVGAMDEFDTAGMHVVVLPANHAAENALHFVFEKEGKRLYYGLDGAWFAPREWRYLHTNGSFDAMIIDATNMSHDPIKFGNYGEHNNYYLLPILLRTLRESGVAQETTKLIADHIGGHMDNVGAIEFVKELGMIAAYDGFSIEV